ncbi:unnamed protein product, partial [Choristocarpus tenellus]
ERFAQVRKLHVTMVTIRCHVICCGCRRSYRAVKLTIDSSFGSFSDPILLNRAILQSLASSLGPAWTSLLGTVPPLVYSRSRIWCGPLSLYGEAFTPPLPLAEDMELAVLPGSDDGSLAFSLVDTQLSMPLSLGSIDMIPPMGWGLATDFIDLFTTKGISTRQDGYSPRQLALTALFAGDVDRILLYLGHLEGENPRAPSRTDRFDDPCAIKERAQKRINWEMSRQNPAKLKDMEAPLWTPAYGPDNFDDGFGDLEDDEECTPGSTNSGSVPQNMWSEEPSALVGRSERGGGQSTALLETIRRLLVVLRGGDEGIKSGCKGKTRAGGEETVGKSGVGNLCFRTGEGSERDHRKCQPGRKGREGGEMDRL